ncbi:hypothetical protein HN865_02190 [Candidatus Woesearchaeota archaeon]|jgi:hypothetical protein|nr:hypothetical protein [Candidatus Woesearchaeota archaeon]
MLPTNSFILAIIIATLAAIVYSLRVLLLVERRVAGMELNIQKIASLILKEEVKIEKALVRKKPVTRKKSTKRKRK